MRQVYLSLAAGAALWLAAAPAGAAPGLPGGIAGANPVQPAAMCGYTCNRGGRYIPGPPSVCAEEGLRYCGSSRDYDDRPRYRERRRDYDDDDDYETPRRGPGVYFGIR
jgi:hypothetical protein